MTVAKRTLALCIQACLSWRHPGPDLSIAAYLAAASIRNGRTCRPNSSPS